MRRLEQSSVSVEPKSRRRAGPTSCWTKPANDGYGRVGALAHVAHEESRFDSSERAIWRSRALPTRSVSASARYSCSTGSPAAAIGTLRYSGAITRPRAVAALPEGVGEAVQHERGLVTEDALLLRPQPEWNEVLVVARRVVHEPNNAALNALEPALVNVELKERKGVARLGRLRVRHVPSLFRGDLEEPIPVGSRAVCRDARHVQTVKPIVC